MPVPKKLKPDVDAKQRIVAWWKQYCPGDPTGLVKEHYFAKEAIGRNWRMDFAWPGPMIAVEFEGGTYTGGRHTRGAGFEKDLEKYNTALILGWRVLKVTTGLVLRKDRIVFKWLEELFNADS
jgi:hypothetical protein